MEKRGQLPKRFSITLPLVASDLKKIDTWIADPHAAAIGQMGAGVSGESALQLASCNRVEAA
jgi:hypothetical protein